MAFQKVLRARNYTSDPNKSEMTIGCYLADTKIKSKSVSFRFTAALIDEVGWQVDDRRVRIGILEGTGEDVGFLQLVNDPDGYTAVQGIARDENEANKYGFTFSMIASRFRYYVLNECPISAMVVNHIIDGNTLIVECPDWLRANVLKMEEDGVGPKPKEPEPVPEPEVVVEEKPKRPMNRHTRRLVGKEIARALRT